MKLENVGLSLKELVERAEKVVELNQLMGKTFNNKNMDAHLMICIMGAIQDAYIEGYKNAREQTDLIHKEI